MIGAAVGYLLETFGNFSMPGYEEWTALIVGFSAALGEVSQTFYMIIKGFPEASTILHTVHSRTALK